MNIPLRSELAAPVVDPLLRIERVSKTYRLRDGRERAALDGVSLELASGEILAVIGSAGSGKSTLAAIACGLEEPETGVVVLESMDIHGAPARLRRSIAVLDADPDLPLHKTVREIVAERREATAQRPETRDRMRDLFEQLGMLGDLDRYPDELSDGARRRAALARALAGEPRLLILDDATSSLDPKIAEAFMRTLARANAETGLAILMVTHEMPTVMALASRVVVLDEGRVVDEGPTARLFARPNHSVSRRFAAAATGATLPPFLCDRLQDLPAPGGRALLRLGFEGEAATKPVLTNVARELGFDFGILAGSLGAAGGEPYGMLIVAAPSDEPYFTASVERLEDAGLVLEVLGFVS